MRAILAVLLVGYGSVTTLGFFREAPAMRVRAGQSSAVAAKGSIDRFLGTWKLIATETRDAKGQVIVPATPPPAGREGFITYAPSGYMGVVIMQGGRQKYAAQQPTPDEARAAVSSYTSYYGPFTVNDAEGFVTHHAQGALSPAMSGVDQKRFFTIAGNRLTLRPPPSASGNQQSLTWERVPDLPNLTPEHKRFIGFWKLISNESRNAKGEVVSSNPGQTGYIIYTASGHMMVHMMQPGRKRYAAQQPTPEESLATLRSYTSYFGPYTIHAKEARPYVVHHRIGIVNPGQVGTDAQRFYQFSGRRLLLQPPPNEVDGQKVQGTITWERVGQ